MSLRGHGLYDFGPYRLDAVKRVLLREGAMVPLPPKAVEVLLVLVESAGQLVEKSELLARVWPDTFVEEGNLAVNIFTLRKALGAADDEGEYIRTVPRRGYTFVAEVTTGAVQIPAAASAPAQVAAGPAQVAQAPSPPPAHTPPDARRARPISPMAGALLAVVLGLLTLSYVRTTRYGTVVVPGEAQALAVLPFVSPGAEAGDEYLGPGLAASVASRLLNLQQVIVRPVSSTVKYGDVTQDPIEAGRALQVDAVLHGTLRRTGDSIQIGATLVRVTDGTRLWHWSSTTTMPEMVVAQGVIADNVARILEPTASEAERAAVVHTPVAGPDAYDAYLRARSAAVQMTARDVEQAVINFTRATDLSPDYADAFSGLSAYLTLPLNIAPTTEKYDRGEAAARRALALNNTLAEPHTVLGRVAVVRRWDWAAAEREFKEAISRAPYDAEPHFWYSLLLSANGRHDAAISEIRFALEVDPSSPRLNLYYGMLLLMARRYDDAIAQLRKSPIEMGVTSQQVYFAMVLAQARKGRFDQALATLDRATGRTQTAIQAAAYRAYILSMANRRAEAEPLLAQLNSTDPIRPAHTIIAGALACGGRMDDAIARLGRAVDERDSRVIFMAVDPILDCARPDPRFGALLARMGLDPRR